MRESDDEDELSDVVMVALALFLMVAVVAMGLIVWASFSSAMAPPMAPSAPGEVQLTAFQSWIVVVVLVAFEGFFLVTLFRHAIVLRERFSWRPWAFRAKQVERSRVKG